MNAPASITITSIPIIVEVVPFFPTTYPRVERSVGHLSQTVCEPRLLLLVVMRSQSVGTVSALATFDSAMRES